MAPTRQCKIILGASIPAVASLSQAPWTASPSEVILIVSFPRSSLQNSNDRIVANMLVGNEEGIAGFEITYSGPTIVFHQPAVIALCGAPMEFHLNGDPVKMWRRHVISKGTEVRVGSSTSNGCRAYLAILGGLPNM